MGYVVIFTATKRSPFFYQRNFCNANFCLNARSIFFNSLARFDIDVREKSCSGARFNLLIIFMRSLPSSVHAVFKNVLNDILGDASYLSIARRNARRRANKDWVPMWL